MAGSRKKGGGEDFGELQARMTRAILMELRNDVEDLLTGLDAGSIDYVLALKALKIQFLEGLKDPLVFGGQRTAGGQFSCKKCGEAPNAFWAVSSRVPHQLDMS